MPASSNAATCASSRSARPIDGSGPRRPVLVTGGSGFIASHCIAALVDAGWPVRTTIRGPASRGRLEAALVGVGVDPARIEVATADLLADPGWDDAVTGCGRILHVASPLPLGAPRDEADLIRPARDGTLRVLAAARLAGVERVVLTSSFAAIGYGHRRPPACYDESHWTDPTAPVSAYIRSKTLAERAAWAFVARDPGALDLVAVNPVAVLGPVATVETSASIEMVRRLLAGRVPACPRLWFGVVDVRDVADLHLRAMTAPGAVGQRLLCAAGPALTVLELARTLADHLPAFARRLPTRNLPDWLVRLAAVAKPELRASLPELGRPRQMSNAHARQLLGWAPRSNAEAINATAESLVKLGLVKPPGRRRRA